MLPWKACVLQKQSNISCDRCGDQKGGGNSHIYSSIPVDNVAWSAEVLDIHEVHIALFWAHTEPRAADCKVAASQSRCQTSKNITPDALRINLTDSIYLPEMKKKKNIFW